MLLPRREQSDIGALKPEGDRRTCFLGRQGRRENLGVRGNPKKSPDYKPGESDQLRTREQILKKLFGLLVLFRTGVVGVEQ